MLVLPTLLAEPCANLHAHLEGDIVGSGQPGQQQQHSMGTGGRTLQPSMASMLFLGGFPLGCPCVKVPQQLQHDFQSLPLLLLVQRTPRPVQ